MAILSAASFAGCFQTEDLARFARVEDAELIVLLPHPDFMAVREGLMRAVKPRGVEIAGPRAAAFVEEMGEVTPAEMPAESKPAFALVFFPEDQLEFRTILIDQYLNFLPGFEFLNEPYKGPYCAAPEAIKRFLLEIVFKDPALAAHLLDQLKESAPDGNAAAGDQAGAAPGRRS